MQWDSWWAAFWYDWRRLNTHMLVVVVVALSCKVHRVYFRHDPDPWLLHPRHFTRRTAPPPPLPPSRPTPYIGRAASGRCSSRAARRVDSWRHGGCMA
jgi:hypothetical protein